MRPQHTGDREALDPEALGIISAILMALFYAGLTLAIGGLL